MTACLTARIEPLEPLMVRAPGGWFWMGCEKKKGVRDSARFDNGPGTFAFAGKQARLPVIGWVKLREELRFPGKAFSATVGHAHLERLQRLSRWHCQKQGTSQTSGFMSSAAS